MNYIVRKCAVMREYMRFQALWPGGPLFGQCPGAFPISTDSVLLAHFTRTEGTGSAADLGCGAGILAVLLCSKAPSLKVSAIDIDPAAAAQCRENFAANGFEGRAEAVAGDLRECRRYYAAGSFDLVVSNPPYFPVNGGKSAPDPRRAAARDERTCSFPELCAAAAYLCRFGGRFAFVHRPERLPGLFADLSGAGFAPKLLRLVYPRPDAGASLALVEARRGGNPGLKVLPPLILREEDGAESAEMREIYHRGAPS